MECLGDALQTKKRIPEARAKKQKEYQAKSSTDLWVKLNKY